MLVLMREDLARELGRADPGRDARLRPVGRRLPPDRPASRGQGRRARDQARARRRRASTPEEVDYVNSHGTGTAKNDPAETARDQGRAWATQARTDRGVSSTKSMIGHLLGAAGAVEGIVTVKAIEDQIAPPTANFTEPDPECDLDYVPNEARALEIDVAISNNFAFGGANASIVFAPRGCAAHAPPAPDLDRVVITGMAALTSAGTDLDALWEAYTTERRLHRDRGGLRRRPGRASSRRAYLSPQGAQARRPARAVRRRSPRGSRWRTPGSS